MWVSLQFQTLLKHWEQEKENVNLRDSKPWPSALITLHTSIPVSYHWSYFWACQMWVQFLQLREILKRTEYVDPLDARVRRVEEAIRRCRARSSRCCGLVFTQVKNIWLGCCAPGSFMTVRQQPEAPFICIMPIPLSCALRNSAFGLRVRVISRHTYTS